MNIQAFFEQSAGKWASQRTSHQLLQNQSESAKTELMMTLLETSDPIVAQLCQQSGLDPAQAVSGLKITWSSIIDRNPKTQTGSSILVAVADLDQPNQGRLISQQAGKATLGRYSLGEDEVLTLITETPELYAEERLWFASPNFRMRTSIVKRSGGFELAAFCTEIRLGITAKPAEAAPAEAQSSV